MHLQIQGVEKSFGDFKALTDINLSVGEHEFVCLLGPSGCGKTTLLRIIAGLVEADRGQLILGGRDLSDIPARKRGFGIVFQSYSLFPNLTAAKNIGYGLKLRKEKPAQIEARVRHLLDLVKLHDLADRYPWQLSGGQQQRVALARALAVDPALILLDEPLSALDARVRHEMRAEIHEVQRRLGIPTVMVTHDQEEALTLADTIVCMNEGKIVQVGTPQDLYMRPRTRFVADFIGVSNLLPLDWVRQTIPDLLATLPSTISGQDGHHLEACLRPESLHVVGDKNGAARVNKITFMGNLSQINIDWNGRELITQCSRLASVSPGDNVRVEVTPEHCSWVQA